MTAKATDMNDFTKEELEKIILSFDWIEGETSWDWEHELRNKIQSMIDNYCEHDWQKGEHLFTDVFCTKCHKSLNDELKEIRS